MVPQTEGTVRGPHPTAHHAHSLPCSCSLAPRGWGNSLCAPGQLHLPGERELSLHLELGGLCLSYALHQDPTALLGGDQPHFQMWKVAVGLVVARGFSLASPLPSCLLTWTLQAHFRVSTLGRGAPCPQLPTGHHEPGAEGITTHLWDACHTDDSCL